MNTVIKFDIDIMAPKFVPLNLLTYSIYSNYTEFKCFSFLSLLLKTDNKTKNTKFETKFQCRSIHNKELNIYVERVCYAIESIRSRCKA